jgi:hypothetical protein
MLSTQLTLSALQCLYEQCLRLIASSQRGVYYCQFVHGRQHIRVVITEFLTPCLKHLPKVLLCFLMSTLVYPQNGKTGESLFIDCLRALLTSYHGVAPRSTPLAEVCPLPRPAMDGLRRARCFTWIRRPSGWIAWT